jgi:threonine synthase
LEYATEWENPSTVAAGLRVPSAVGDFLILNVIRESKGVALAVSDDALMRDCRALAKLEGIFSAPEGGASLACLRRLLDSGLVNHQERVVVFITGSGYKYLDVLKGYD